MIFYSWNVNGLRAAWKKEDFQNWFNNQNADIIAFQETRATLSQLDPKLITAKNYHSFWHSATKKKGYSGVGVLSKHKPLNVISDLPEEKWQGEGRLLHLEYDNFHFLNVYFPNGQSSSERLTYKLGYYDAFLSYVQKLRLKKPLVICGDFNTAHKAIDIARPDENKNTSGFLPIERAWLDKFIAAGYIDTFRLINQDILGKYSWWSYRSQARKRNIGWRLDYFFVSQELKKMVRKAWIEDEIKGSDHSPVGLELEF